MKTLGLVTMVLSVVTIVVGIVTLVVARQGSIGWPVFNFGPVLVGILVSLVYRIVRVQRSSFTNAPVVCMPGSPRAGE